MVLRLCQQVFRDGDQLAELPAVNLACLAALQTQHAPVEGHAGLVQANPCVGKLGHVLAGELRNIEIIFIVIERGNEHAG